MSSVEEGSNTEDPPLDEEDPFLSTEHCREEQYLPTMANVDRLVWCNVDASVALSAQFVYELVLLMAEMAISALLHVNILWRRCFKSFSRYCFVCCVLRIV